MPQNSRTHTQGFLDQLSTEQLLDLLRTEPEDEDDGLTNRILEVIEERERAHPTGLLPDVDQAWEDFQKYFNTPDGTGRPLYPTKDPEDKPPKTAPARARPRLLRRLLPMAAAIAVALSCLITAQAMGVDVFGRLAQWTSETFHFASAMEADTKREAASPENEAIRLSIQEALDQCGVTAVSAPSWYPEGSEPVRDVDVAESQRLRMVSYDLTYDDKTFGIRVYRYLATEVVPAKSFEKDASNVEEYHSSGRLFYLMENPPDSRATYSDGQTVMLISGELSMEYLKKMVDSIGE